MNRDLAFHNAIVAFEKKTYDSAIMWFEEALKKPFLGGANNDGLILNNIATVYNKKERYDKAVLYYEKAIDYGLINSDVYFSLAASYIHLGENQRVLEIYNSIIDINPNNGKAYYLRGKHFQRMGDHTKGNSDITRAATLNYFG